MNHKGQNRVGLLDTMTLVVLMATLAMSVAAVGQVYCDPGLWVHNHPTIIHKNNVYKIHHQSLK